MRRREFLRSAGALALGASAGAGVLLRPRGARAFGEAPEEAEGVVVPEELRAESILEVFLYGGVSQYESFYCVPELGASDGTGWHLFLNSGDVDAAAVGCGLSGPLTEPFASDSDGQEVHLGPYVMPLRERPDITSRMRVSITRHDLEPHEGAIPLALAGRGLGHPGLAGLGSHVQRYFLQQNDEAGRAPFSYVLLSTALNAFPTDNVRSAIAIGMHPGAARPLSLKVDAAGDLAALLARSGLGDRRQAYDAAMAGYIERYNARLRHGGKGDPLRSPRLGDLSAAHASIANADAISAVLPPAFFDKTPGESCGEAAEVDATAMNLRLAAHLLTHPTSRARYCCVIDAGLLPADGGGGYDTHFETPYTQARNLTSTLRALASVIKKPGENDATKIDLDKTMVVLTTEFGRSPFAQGKLGRNHWPYGYPIVFLGGPVRKRGVFGATGNDARATLASSPQENRIAALLALGIWPFAPESYNVSDVPGATDERSAAAQVKKRQLGLS